MNKAAQTVAVSFDFPIPSVKNFQAKSGWFNPEIAIKNKWYLVLYYGELTPYVVKYDGNYWRDSSDKLMPVPMFVIPVPPAPPLKKKDSSAE